MTKALRRSAVSMSDMSFIVPGGHGPVGSVNRLAAAAVASNGFHKAASVIEITPGLNGSAGIDRVELSEFARHLDTLRTLPDVRFDLVAEVRRAIADGTYESDEKLDLAIERMAQEESL